VLTVSNVSEKVPRVDDMNVYKVFNEHGAAVKVSDEDLDSARAGTGPLTTQLANAAGVAKRHDLAPRLRATLAGPDRQQKLAAAYSLLAMAGPDSATLNQLAAAEADDVCAGMFAAIALRMEGLEPFRRAFDEGTTASIAGWLISVYNGPMDLTAGDVGFLVDALAAYLDKTLEWIAALSAEIWRSDVYLVLDALSREQATALLGREQMVATRVRLAELLVQIKASRADGDSKALAKSLVAKLNRPGGARSTEPMH